MAQSATILSGHMMRSPGGLIAGTGPLKVIMCPRRVDVPGPSSHCWGGVLHCRSGCVRLDAPMMRAGALLRADPTRSSDTGTVRGFGWQNLPRERKGK